MLSMEEYKIFHGKKVELITDGRVLNNSNWKQVCSLQLEGILESETDTL